MDPLPLKTRRFYSVLFFILFIFILPVVALYASGYRLGVAGLVATGGIYVATPTSGLTISLNGEEKERSSIFSKSFFFDNLPPASYVVQATAEGNYPWSKTLTVEPRLVTDVSVLVVAQPLIILEVATSTPTEAIGEPTVATSTLSVVSEQKYAEIVALFTATTTIATSTLNTPPPNTASTTSELNASSTRTIPTEIPIADLANNVALIIENGDLYAVYQRSNTPSSSFCARPTSCVVKFPLERGVETVTDAQFFAGGALYRTRESGVYFTEVDVRQPRLVIPVFTAPRARFHIVNGDLIVGDGTTYYEVVGF